MADFLLKYWLQVLFAGIVTLCGVFHKNIKSWRDAHKAQEAKTLKDSIVKEVKEALEDLAHRSDENDKVMRAQIDEVRAGLLAVQGDHFKTKCREALKEDSVITLELFENLEQDHAAYNGLGGNHDGDQLFELVKRKFSNSL